MADRKHSQLFGAFSLMELLVVITIITLLAAMILPSLSRAKSLARQTACSANLRAINTALLIYLECSGGEFFPYSESSPEGTLWYWGLATSAPGTAEGSRPIDKTKAKLAPYFASRNSVAACPDMPTGRGDFKPKFNLAGYGYGINGRMLAGRSGGLRFDEVTRPGDTVTWADCMQINTWLAPASPSRPMLEEHYYLDNCINQPATFHFRHMNKCNASYADGSVRSLASYWLDHRCDGLVGRPERPVHSSQVSEILRLDK